MAGEVKAAPRRMPARPKALESVCMTTRFGHSSTHSASEEPAGAKSM